MSHIEDELEEVKQLIFIKEPRLMQFTDNLSVHKSEDGKYVMSHTFIYIYMGYRFSRSVGIIIYDIEMSNMEYLEHLSIPEVINSDFQILLRELNPSDVNLLCICSTITNDTIEMMRNLKINSISFGDKTIIGNDITYNTANKINCNYISITTRCEILLSYFDPLIMRWDYSTSFILLNSDYDSLPIQLDSHNILVCEHDYIPLHPKCYNKFTITSTNDKLQFYELVEFVKRLRNSSIKSARKVA